MPICIDNEPSPSPIIGDCSISKPFQNLPPSSRVTDQTPSSDEIVASDIVSIFDSVHQVINTNLGCPGSVYSGGNTAVFLATGNSGRTFSGGNALCTTNVNLSQIYNSNSVQITSQAVNLVPISSVSGSITGNTCSTAYTYNRATSYQVISNDTTVSWNGQVVASPWKGILPPTANSVSSSSGTALLGQDGFGNATLLGLSNVNDSISYPSVSALSNIIQDGINNQDEYCRTTTVGGFPTVFDNIVNPWHALLVKLNSSANGSGKYLGYLVALPTSSISATTALTEADLGSLTSSSSQVLILNNAELGLSNSHYLLTSGNAQRYFNAVLRETVAATSSTSAQLVVSIDGVLPSSSATVQLATINGYNGTGPCSWNPYLITLFASSSTTAYNGMEPVNGSPGSLGVNVGTNGSVNGGTCFVQPIGAGAVVITVWDTVNGRWTFSTANSAQ